MSTMDDDLRAMLQALGPGGTRELAERALAYTRERERVVVGVTRVDAMVRTLDLVSADLVGLQEAAQRLGVSRQTLGHWISGRRGPGGFPDPLAQLSMGPVWDYRDIARWNDVMKSSVEAIHA